MSTSTTSERSAAAGGAALGGGAGLLLLLLEGGLDERWETLRALARLYVVCGAVLGAAVASGGARLLPRLLSWPRWRRLPVAAGLLAALALTAWPGGRADRRQAPSDAPDLLLVTVDTCRADRWWAVADAEAARGGFDWRADAVVFERCYAASGLTAPSHASLFTGALPHEHGVTNNGQSLPESERRPSFVRALREGGWTTLAAPSVLHLDPAFGFGQGFDRFVGVEAGWRRHLRPLRPFLLPRVLLRFGSSGRPTREGARTIAAAERLWAEAGSAEPRFLWLHVFDPHWPYVEDAALEAEVAGLPWSSAPHANWDDAEIRALRRRYDAGVLATQRALAAFLERRREEARSGRPLRWIVTADHGEGIGEHGAVDHGDLLYDEQLLVPLVLGGDATWPARAEPAPVAQRALAATMLALAGLEPVPDASAFPVASLLPAVASGGAPPDAPVLAETRHRNFDNAMAVSGRMKAIRNLLATPSTLSSRPGRRARRPLEDPPCAGDREWYALGEDPAERVPLTPAQAAAAAARDAEAGRVGPAGAEGVLRIDDARRAARVLEDLLRSRGPVPSEDLRGPGLAPDVLAALRELGYL